MSNVNAYPLFSSKEVDTELAIALGYKLSNSKTNNMSFLPDALAPPTCCE